MRVSVVVSTHNRVASLRTLLDALAMQSHEDFEVVVVDGPSTDGTAELLEEYAGAIRVARCLERNLSMSRNIGIDHAAGDVVAFIDDDSIPEPSWLTELVAGYADGAVSGVGGLVRAPNGLGYQYRFSLCDRLGDTSFPIEMPGPQATEPGADPFLYLQGTNASFLRSALEAVQGFDEELAYMYDETELCATLIDAGHRIRSLDGAVVHHKFLPSHVRTAVGFTDPFHAVKNRAYVALRFGRDRAGEAAIVAAQRKAIAESVGWAQYSHRAGGLTAPEVARYVRRAEKGLELGLERGRRGQRMGRPIAPRDPDAFLPFPRRVAADCARIVFTSSDYPPKSMAGIARFTVDLAEGMARRGHDVHVVTRDEDGPPRVDYEHGVWVHRYQVNRRFLPELDGSAVVHGLEQSAAIYAVVERIHASHPVDVVCGPLWGGETLVSTLDPRLRVVTTCMTPMRVVVEMQERLSKDPAAAAMIALEDATLTRSSLLVPISAANAAVVEQVPGVAGRPSVTEHLGIVDRRHETTRRRDPADGAVELLFVGRLEARKGVDVLLEAAVGVLARNPAARLRLVGEDNAAWSAGEDWAASVEELAAGDESVVERIVFEGRLDDDALQQAYADADVFVAPSRYESFGLVVAEAMMMRLPVVSCAVGGVPEVAVDGETALLVPPGDAPALERALEAVVRDASLRDRLAAAGRARFEATFENEVVVDRYLRILTRPAAEAEPRAADTVEAGAELLTDLVGLRGGAASDAAAALVDPRRYPRDLMQELGPLNGARSEVIAEGALRAVLGRDPRPSEVEDAVAELEPFAPLAAGAAAAVTAAGLATDVAADAPAALPQRRPAEILADVRRAWMQADDEAFPRALAAALAVTDDAWLIDLAADALAGGGRRLALQVLMETPRVQRRVGVIPGIEHAALRTEAEVAEELGRLASLPTEEMIERAFVLLIGREPDPAGRANSLRQLAGTSRAAVLHGLVDTPSALAYGTDPAVVHALIAAIGDLERAPVARRLRGRRRVQRLELLARDARFDLMAAGRAARRAPAPSKAEQEPSAGIPAEVVAALRHGQASAGEQLAAVTRQLAALQRAQLAARGAARSTERRLAEVAAAVEATPGSLSGELTGGFGAIDARLHVLSAKYEALAIDMRERIPPVLTDEVIAPRVLDPAALEPGAKVNLGAGEKPLPGYVNVDFRALDGVEVVADVRDLPFAPGSLGEIASHHLVEHFRQAHLEQIVLPHWRDLLRDDGVLRVVTPNLAVLTEWFRTGRLDQHEFKKVLFGLQDYAGDDHFALYTPETLRGVLERAGFTNVRVLETARPNGSSPELEMVANPARG